MGWAYLRVAAGSTHRFALLFLGAFLVSIAYFAFALPSISFVPPTLNDSSTTGANWVFVNVTSTEPLNQSLLEWVNLSGIYNLSMLNSSPSNWYINVTNIPVGNFNYTVWAQNTSGYWNQSARRFVATRYDIVTIGMPDVFQKADNGNICANCTYRIIGNRIVFNQSYNMTKIGFWEYAATNPTSGNFSVYLVGDGNGEPNMSQIFTSNEYVNTSPYSTKGTGLYYETLVPVTPYVVSSNTPYWVAIQKNENASVTIGGGALTPSRNFDANYTSKFYNGSSWVNHTTQRYGVVWVETNASKLYGQLKERRDTFFTYGNRFIGQNVFMPSNGSYTLDTFSFYLWDITGTPEDNLYLNVMSLDNNSLLWNVSLGSSFTINSINTINFSDPKPVINNVSKIRFYLNSPGSSSGNQYELNSIEYVNKNYTWGNSEETTVWTMNGGSSWSNQEHLDFQGSFGAHTTANTASESFDNNPDQFWVRTDGNDTCSGQNNMNYAENSTDCAWKTITHAATLAQAGNTIYVASGDYGNETVSVSNSGNSTNWITFTTYGGTVMLNGNGTGNGFTINSKSYINISGDFRINNYADGIYGGGGLAYITIFNVKVLYSVEGIYFRDNASYITINNVTVRNASEHGIVSFGYPYASALHHHITIINSIIDDTHHNGIDLHTNNQDVLIENNTITNVTNSAGVFSHNSGGWTNYNKGIIIRNNVFSHNTRGVWLLSTNDTIVEQNIFIDSYSYYAVYLDREGGFTGVHNVTLKNNSFQSSASYDVSIFPTDAQTDTISDIVFENNSFSSPVSIYFHGDTYNITGITIRNSRSVTAILQFSGGILDSLIEFTNGGVFSENTPNTPYWNSNKSNMSISGINGTYTLTTYDLTARPSSGFATITTDGVNLTLIQTDLTSLPSPKVWNMTIYSNYSNTTATFNLSTGLSSKNFSLYRNGSLYANLTTNSTGGLNYKYAGGGFGTLEFSFQEQVPSDCTRYVATYGNNSKDGMSLTNAWQNVSYATQQAVAGDTICLVDGTWYGEEAVFANNGTEAMPITLTAYNGTPTLIDDNDSNHQAIYIRGKQYINLERITMRDYFDSIYVRQSSYISVSNVTIYFNAGEPGSPKSAAIMFNDDMHHSNITYTKVVGINTGLTTSDMRNSVGVAGSYYSGGSWYSSPSTDILIANNEIYGNAEHGLIDLMGNVSNIIIEGNTLYNSTNGTIYYSAIYYHQGFPQNITIRNNWIHDTAGIGGGGALSTYQLMTNSLIENNTLFNSIDGIKIYSADDLIIRNNTIYNITNGQGIYVWGKNNSAYNNNVYGAVSAEYRFSTGINGGMNNTVTNPFGTGYRIISTNDASITLEYTFGDLFSETGGNSPRWYPDRGTYSLVANETVTITVYNLTARPSSGYATITTDGVNLTSIQTDLTAMPSPKVWNMTIYSNYSNTTATFNLSTGLSSTIFSVYRNGMVYTAATTNASGWLNYKYSGGGFGTLEFSFQEGSIISTSLNSPQTSLLTNNATILFNCSASSGNSLVNITLYGNWSGGWHANQTVNLGGTSNSTIFAKTITPDGSYKWNCLAFDTAGNYSFALSNYTLTIDTTPPSTITNLQNQSSGDSWILWNWTNPASDFDHAEVYLNGTWKANTSNNFYNATGLDSGALYEIQIRTVDAAGNVNGTWVNSGARTLSDATPPSITIVRPENTTYNYNQSLTLNFSLSEPASWCGYSLDGASNVTLPFCLNTSFNVSSGGLHAIQVYANDTAGNMNSSVVYFTVDLLAPVVSNISSGSITSSSATILWDTDEPGNSTVYYGPTINTTLNASNSTFTTHHSISLDGLSASTLYYYNVSSCDAVGNCNVSAQYQFTTSGGSTAPPGFPPSGGSQPAVVSSGTNSVLLNAPLVRVVVALRSELSTPSLVVTMPPVVPIVSPSGVVYHYLNLTKLGFNNSDIENASIEFKVNKSWLDGNSIAAVYLARYSNSWTRLRTELVSSTVNYNTYRAYTNTFSYFAILGEAVSSQMDLPPVVNETPVFVAPNQSVPAPVIVTQNDIDAFVAYLNSVAPQTQKAKQMLEQARLKLAEAQGALNNNEQERAKHLLDEAVTLADQAAGLKVVSVSQEKSVIFTLLLALTALTLGGYAYYSRHNGQI